MPAGLPMGGTRGGGGGGGGGSPGGADTQIQYNSAGAFAGSASLAFDGTYIVGSGIINPGGSVKLGDPRGDGNGTVIAIDDSAGTITFAGIFQISNINAQPGGDLNLGNNSSSASVTVADAGTVSIAASSVTLSVLTTGTRSTHDISITDDTKGIVLKSPNGHYWRQTISNAGAVTWTDIGTSPP